MELFKEDSKPGSEPYMFTEKEAISTLCKVCKKDFTKSAIFKHISHSLSCKAGYSADEIQAFKNRTRAKKIQQLKESYNPAERREKYQKEKRCLKEIR